MSSAYNPRWTPGGPLDDASILKSHSDNNEDFHLVDQCIKTSDRSQGQKYLFATERLTELFPSCAWVTLRLGIAHLMLEDLSGALELFQETQALIGTGSDEDFDMYVKEVKALVEREAKADDDIWNSPDDGGIIAQQWHPPRPLQFFQTAASAELRQVVEDIISLWSQSDSELKQRYERVVAVQSSEIEGVFKLDEQSLARIAIGGYSEDNIGVLVTPPPGGDKTAVVYILSDFSLCVSCLDEIASTVAITHKDVNEMHQKLMKSARLGVVEYNSESFSYLNTVGRYRTRIVTSELPSESDSDTEPARIVQFARHQEIERSMETFLTLFHEELRNQIGSTDIMRSITIAAWAHYNLAIIHPYTDGNGRLTRILASLPFRVQSGQLEIPPLINIRPSVKTQYLECLHIAATQADLRPLMGIVAEEMRETVKYLANLKNEIMSLEGV